MNTANKLNALTSDFYSRFADSFSATREHPWAGWNRCASHIEGELAPVGKMRILDVGCGNLRFEEFLYERINAELEVWAIDNCPKLVCNRSNVRYLQADVISALLEGSGFAELPALPQCDLSCAFGLLHHVPGQVTRKRLLDGMVDSVRTGGLVMVTLWRFMHDERLARKACEVTKLALQRFPDLDLDEGDWLLGWQDGDALRYCHSFADVEIDGLVSHLDGRARLIDRFFADGKTSELNCYLVFEKA